MDHGWILTFAAREAAAPQISIATEGGSGTPVPDLSIEVDNLDEVHQRVLAAGSSIEYGPTSEPWGVRRFYVSRPFWALREDQATRSVSVPTKVTRCAVPRERLGDLARNPLRSRICACRALQARRSEIEERQLSGAAPARIDETDWPRCSNFRSAEATAYPRLLGSPSSLPRSPHRSPTASPVLAHVKLNGAS